MRSTRKLVAVGAVIAVAASSVAFAETAPSEQHPMAAEHQHTMPSGQQPMEPEQMQEMMRQHQSIMPMGAHGGMRAAATTPTMPGQDAFGAIQEIVQLLDAEPKTDWSKVDLEALRQHLIDMDEVTLRADVAPKEIDGGLEIAVTGSGRTLIAIRRMVGAWAGTMNGHQGWTTKASQLSNGELLTVAATDPKEVQHIRGLGFIGLLVSGSHHQMHHLAIAKGEFAQEHPGRTH
jgi:hypothetical protein